ncbi:hypothetical protein OG206_30375 [Streptomyces sp. NBC_01341]|nr:hypothetical protein OG206_30375 [Streptomyces sp. NBC_01341]
MDLLAALDEAVAALKASLDEGVRPGRPQQLVADVQRRFAEAADTA